jgi:hypothetical protein
MIAIDQTKVTGIPQCSLFAFKMHIKRSLKYSRQIVNTANCIQVLDLMRLACAGVILQTSFFSALPR